MVTASQENKRYSEQDLCSPGGGMDAAHVFLWLALCEVVVQLLLPCL